MLRFKWIHVNKGVPDVCLPCKHTTMCVTDTLPRNISTMTLSNGNISALLALCEANPPVITRKERNLAPAWVAFAGGWTLGKRVYTLVDISQGCTVYPKKYAHGFVVLCFVVVMQSFIMNSHEVFIHIHQGCFAGTGAIVRLPQCQWSKPDGYGKISQCITTTKHSKAKTVCIFLGIYCSGVTVACQRCRASDWGLLPGLAPGR